MLGRLSSVHLNWQSEGESVFKKLFVCSLVIVSAAASQALTTLTVTIQPILVANDDGSNLSPDLSYQDYAQKIWSQADIDLVFLSAVTLNKSSYNSWDYNNSNSMVVAPGNGQSSNPLVVNAWFVHDVYNASVYGFGYLNAPYMVMDTSGIASYSALGRVDTFAHELGHVLNLYHYDDTNPGDAGKAKHLMASGGIRLIPQQLGDVAPDGLGYDLLGQDEIAIARRSKFAIAGEPSVPGPAAALPFAIGFIAACKKRRRSA